MKKLYVTVIGILVALMLCNSCLTFTTVDDLIAAAANTANTSGGPVGRPAAANKVTIVDAVWSEADTPEEDGYKAFDGDVETRWVARGIGPWIIFEFDTEAEINVFLINYYRGSERRYSFELEYSVDNVEFIPLWKGASNNVQEFIVELPTPVTAKYIKYIGYANNTNEMNSVSEVEFFRK